VSPLVLLGGEPVFPLTFRGGVKGAFAAGREEEKKERAEREPVKGKSY